MAEAASGNTVCALTLSRRRHGMLVSALAEAAAPLAISDHFTVYGLPDDIVVVHDFVPAQIDNNIGGYVANELLPLLAGAGLPPAMNGYGLSEQQLFEGYVGAIVRSVDASERRAWHLFYDNTLAALQGSATSHSGMLPQDFIADFRAIYRKVAELLAAAPGADVLDVATCFGFLPLLLASRSGKAATSHVIACDHNPALVALAEDYRRHRDLPGLAFIRADILADDLAREFAPHEPCFDIVLAIHLLEHLGREETFRAFDNLWALTRRRLIIAVPFEGEPDARFGHRQTFDEASLAVLGARAGANGRHHTFAHHGGWLIVDRNPADVTQWERQQ